eukprot:GFUD01037712.1.p1 GENE.GFUD01037712.1~~GFUD01037712.1.p1  ORF type:complete len:193 (-),score=41.62 GFUD01037712.1:85-663(-)
MNYLFFISSFCLASCFAFPNISIRSKCPPKPPTITEFNATEYLGVWYEQRRFPAFFQLNTRCVQATYGVRDDGRVTVHNVATKENGDFDYIDGSAFVKDPNFPGELTVEFPGNPAGSYWVLETDYHNFSVVYSCEDFLFGAIKLEFAWLLSREQHLDPEMLEYATNVYVKNGIDIALLEDTLQNEECYYGEE